MVQRIQGLPSLPGVTPSRGTPTVAQANPSAGDAMASAFSSVAQGAREINQSLQPVFDQRAQQEAMDDAEEAAAASEEQGRVVTPELRTAFTRQDQIYNQTVTQLTHARTMNDAREAFERMRRDYAFEPEQFDAAVRAWRDAYVSDLDTPYRVELEAAVDRMSLDYGLRVQDERRMRDAGEALKQNQLRLTNLRDEIFSLTADGEEDSEAYAERVAEYKDILNGLADDPLIDFSEANVTAYMDQLEAEQEYGLARREIDALVAAGDFSGAFDRAAEIPRELGYGAEDTDRLTGALQTYVRSQRVEADRREAAGRRDEAMRHAENFNGFLRDIARGEVLTFDDFDTAYEQGRISDAQRTSLYQQVGRAAQREAELVERFNAISEQGGRGNPRNPDDRDAADAVYAARLAERAENAAPELLAAPGTQGGVSAADRQAVAVSIAREIGIVPPAFADSMTAMLHSSTPEVAMTALEAVGAMSEAAGYATGVAFDSDTLDQANAYRELVAAGMPVEEAVADILRLRDPANAAVAEARQARIDDLLDPDEGGISISREVERLFGVGAEGVPLDRAELFYRRNFERVYSAGGSVAHAQARARAALQRTYGVSEATGVRRVMAYPPERFPGNDTGDTRWMRAQLADAIMEQEGMTIDADQGGTFMFVNGRRVEVPAADSGDIQRQIDRVVETAQLIPDAQTTREFQSGVTPTYRVVYEDQDGVLQTLGGAEYRFFFDPTDELRAIGEGAQQALAEGAARRAEQDERVLESLTRNRGGGVLGFVEGRPILNPNYEAPE